MLYNWPASSIWQHSIPLKLEPKPKELSKQCIFISHTTIVRDCNSNTRCMELVIEGRRNMEWKCIWVVRCWHGLIPSQQSLFLLVLNDLLLHLSGAVSHQLQAWLGATCVLPLHLHHIIEKLFPMNMCFRSGNVFVRGDHRKKYCESFAFYSMKTLLDRMIHHSYDIYNPL